MFFDTLQRLSQYSVLSSINGARLSTRSLVALLVSEECFWSAKTRKRLEKFEIHTSHGPGAEKLLGHIWRKMYTLLFWFNVLVGIVSWVSGLSFFIRGPGFGLKIPRHFFTETFAIRFQNWFDHKWIQIGVFVWLCPVSPLSYLLILKFARNAPLLFLFCSHEVFPVFNLGFFWSVLWRCFTF